MSTIRPLDLQSSSAPPQAIPNSILRAGRISQQVNSNLALASAHTQVESIHDQARAGNGVAAGQHHKVHANPPRPSLPPDKLEEFRSSNNFALRVVMAMGARFVDVEGRRACFWDLDFPRQMAWLAHLGWSYDPHDEPILTSANLSAASETEVLSPGILPKQKTGQLPVQTQQSVRSPKRKCDAAVASDSGAKVCPYDGMSPPTKKRDSRLPLPVVPGSSMPVAPEQRNLTEEALTFFAADAIDATTSTTLASDWTAKDDTVNLLPPKPGWNTGPYLQEEHEVPVRVDDADGAWRLSMPAVERMRDEFKDRRKSLSRRLFEEMEATHQSPRRETPGMRTVGNLQSTILMRGTMPSRMRSSYVYDLELSRAPVITPRRPGNQAPPS